MEDHGIIVAKASSKMESVRVGRTDLNKAMSMNPHLAEAYLGGINI